MSEGDADTGPVDATTEARRLLRLAGPLILSQLAVMGMSVTDAVIAGHYATPDLAGISLANSIWGPLLVVGISLVVSVNPFLAQHFGAGRLRAMGNDAVQGLWLALGAGLAMAVLVLAARPLLQHLGAEAAVVDVAQDYLVLILWGAPALTASLVLRALAEASGYPRITMQVHGVALLLNALLDYWFVFGGAGMPAMGGAGCGLASALVYWFIALAVLAHLLSAPRYRPMQLFRGRLRADTARLRELLRLGLPMAMGAAAETSLFNLCGLLIAGFGAISLAAHQVAMSVSALMFMVPLGLSMALTIRIAQGLGADDQSAAVKAARAGTRIALVFAACSGLVMLLAAPWIAARYTPDPDVRELAVVLLYFGAAFQFADAAQICCNGALRGYRDTFVPMLILIFSFWGIGAGLAIGLGYGFIDLGVEGVTGFWVGLVAALTAAYVLLMERLRWTSGRVSMQADQSPAATADH